MATSMRFALVMNSEVINIVLWDGEAEFTPEGELINIEDHPEIGIGWTYIDGEFIPPDPAPEETELFTERFVTPPVDDLQQQIIELQQRIDALEAKKK